MDTIDVGINSAIPILAVSVLGHYIIPKLMA
jgi:hypothetical protein